MKIKITETEDRVWSSSKSMSHYRAGSTPRQDHVVNASRHHDEKARPVVEKLLTFLDGVLGVQTVATAEQSKDSSQFVVQVRLQADPFNPSEGLFGHKYSATPVMNGNRFDTRPTRYNTLPFEATESDFSRIASECVKGFKKYVNEKYSNILLFYPRTGPMMSELYNMFSSNDDITLFESLVRNVKDTLINKQQFRNLFENTELEVYLDMTEDEFIAALDEKLLKQA